MKRKLGPEFNVRDLKRVSSISPTKNLKLLESTRKHFGLLCLLDRASS